MKKFVMCVLLAVSLLLAGCSFGSFSVDTLLTAPKLSKEQQEIHEKLIQSVGSDIVLKYPQSGENRSAFVVANIDDEPTDEAIVFYEYSSLLNADVGINICVLDKTSDDKWEVKYKFSGPGTDIDRIIITRLGKNEKLSIIVGYSTLSINEKTLEIYNFSEGVLNLVATDTYNVIETIDLNNDNYSEIVLVQSGAESSNATASLLSVNNSQIEKSSVTEMSSTSESIVYYTKGKVTAQNKALFVDCRNVDGTVHTEIFYYRYNNLQNPMNQIGHKLISRTVRPDGYYSADVDGDGIIEIPTVKVLKGYEAMPAEEQLYLTTWNGYSDYYNLTEKLVGFYSIPMGYMFSFPESWLDKVTVKRDDVTGENVFYEFNNSLEESTSELMRIAVCPKSESEEYHSMGYQLITSLGQIDYLVKISDNPNNELQPNISTVRRYFYVVS